MKRFVTHGVLQATLARLRSSSAGLRGNIWVYIGGLFLLSRLLYIGLGDVSVRMLDQYMPPSMTAYSTQVSDHSFIQMWYVWDAVHYTNMAQTFDLSLSTLTPEMTLDGKNAYYLLHWFPLYPVLGKLLHTVTHISIPFSLLLISNAALLGSMYLIYRLVRLDGAKDSPARKVVALLILLPTSFIFSAALSESLFLLLALLTLYLARRERWLLAGGAGFLLALTHSHGFLISLPLIVEAYQQYGLKPSNIQDKLRPYVKPLIACVLTVLGIVVFIVYGWLRTKNLMAYIDTMHVSSGIATNNPLLYVLQNLFKLRTLIILGELLLIALVWRKLRWSYIAYALIFTLITLAIGDSGVTGMLRYMSVVFPVAIAAAYLTERPNTANFIWVSLGIANGALFIMWANWWTGFII